MVDQKVFMKGFLEYLQQYYGINLDMNGDMSKLLNTTRLPVFHQRALAIEKAEQLSSMMEPRDPSTEMAAMQGMPGMPGMDMMGMGGMPPGIGGMMQPEELNSMFPGPYSRMG